MDPVAMMMAQVEPPKTMDRGATIAQELIMQQQVLAATAAAAVAAGTHAADNYALAAGLTPEQQAFAKILREKEQQTMLLQMKIQSFGRHFH